VTYSDVRSHLSSIASTTVKKIWASVHALSQLSSCNPERIQQYVRPYVYSCTSVLNCHNG
jgi:hypothetical protein